MKRLDAWLFHSYRISTEGLALYRIFVGLMILYFLMPPFSIYSYIGQLPSDFYTPPPGPMMLFSGFPSAITLQLLHLLLIRSAGALLVGYRTRLSSLLTGLLMLTLKGFIYSVGKINHDLMISLVPLLFAFSNWGGAWSIDSLQASKRNGRQGRITEREQGWPLVILSLCIGFMFFTAAFPKVLGGWLDPTTQASRGHFLNQYFPKERTDLLAGFFLGVESPLFWEFLDIATIVFEAGFLLAILHPATTRLFVCMAVLFHFSTMMVMNIAFLFNFVGYAAFLNWDRIRDGVERVSAAVARWFSRQQVVAAAARWFSRQQAVAAAARWFSRQQAVAAAARGFNRQQPVAAAAGRFNRKQAVAAAAGGRHNDEGYSDGGYNDDEYSDGGGGHGDQKERRGRYGPRSWLPPLLWGGGLTLLFGLISLSDRLDLFVDSSDLVAHEVILVTLAVLIAIPAAITEVKAVVNQDRFG